MRARTVLAYFHLLNFAIMVILTVYLLNVYWVEMEEWWMAVYGYYLILGFSGMAISVWMALDGRRLERYATNMKKLEEKLILLEKKIRIIKPRNNDKSS